jgi:hypothetical protein
MMGCSLPAVPLAARATACLTEPNCNIAGRGIAGPLDLAQPALEDGVVGDQRDRRRQEAATARPAPGSAARSGRTPARVSKMGRRPMT